MSNFAWANEATRTFMSRGYLAEGETVEERSWEIAKEAERILELPGFAEKFFGYLSKGYYSLASPVWSNFGRNGLSISCNGSYVGDSISQMLNKTAEVGMMTKHGAGTSGYFGDIRPRGTKISAGGTSDGPVHFMSLFETVIDIVSQGNVRRGNFAAYLPVEHEDIKEFLEIREEGNPIQKLSMGVTITDVWMRAMVEGDAEKRSIWARIIRKRYETGFPYVIFIDNAYNGAPDWYRGLIKASNLCTEIFEPQSDDESFVCCLSSMNLALADFWMATDAVETLIYFLDAVMSEYITKTRNLPHMEAAHRFAVRHRALGVGSLGYHTALQKKMIPFESMEAKLLNVKLHKFIFERADKASRKLASYYGEPEALVGTGRRNGTICAIAPTTSSSFILGQISPSIEALYSNYFTKNLAKGKFTWRNPELEKIIGQDETIWRSILQNGGSVQHLDCLTDEEKNVFKTFGEISQMEIVQQAAARQNWLDQGQSTNLMIHPKVPAKQVSELMIAAWGLGLKSLYYQRSTNPAQDLVLDILSCSACEA
jgi:ribonucleoside-diphosphate reductase alpha chain